MKPHPLMEIKPGDRILKAYYDNDYLIGLDLEREDKIYKLRSCTRSSIYSKTMQLVTGYISVGLSTKKQYSDNQKPKE